MKNILIVTYFIGERYNSTGKIDRWIKTVLENVFIHEKRKIVIYTDNKDYLNIKYENYDNTELIFDYRQNSLDTYYLLCTKFHIIFDAFLKYKDSYDYICFIQSNFIALDVINIIDVLNKEQKIQLIQHKSCHNSKEKYRKIYGSNINTSVDLNKIIMNYDKWIYYQSGFSTYTVDMFMYLFNEINKLMLLDFYNNKRVVWHDETYLNYIIQTKIDKNIINTMRYYIKFDFLNKNNIKYINL